MLSNRKKEYLDAMGIDVWVRRDPPHPDSQAAPASSESAAVADPIAKPAPARTVNDKDIAQLDWDALQARVAALTPAERYAVCSRLKRTSTAVLAAMKTAELRPSEAWERFAERYQRLAFDLGLALKRAQCR